MRRPKGRSIRPKCKRRAAGLGPQRLFQRKQVLDKWAGFELLRGMREHRPLFATKTKMPGQWKTSHVQPHCLGPTELKVLTNHERPKTLKKTCLPL